LVVGLGAAATLALGAFLMNEPDAGWIALAGLYPLTHTLELSTVALRNRIQWKPQVAMRSIASGLRLALVTGAILMGETRAGVILVLIASASTMGNILLHRVGKPLLPRGTFQAVPMGPFLRLALPLGIAALAQQLYFYVDNLFVRAHWGEASVGTYNVAVRIMSWSLSLAVYAAAAALPWLSRAHKRGELVPAAMRLTLPLTLGASLAVALLWPFAGDLLALFGEPFRAAEGALQLLLLAVICVHAGAPLTTALVAAGRTPAILALTLSALLINLGLNSLWVPTEGLVGAARATLITEGWIAVGAALSLILRARR
jgi:O-antigen/teichoic acid export membrane protein